MAFLGRIFVSVIAVFCIRYGVAADAPPWLDSLLIGGGLVLLSLVEKTRERDQ